MTLPAVEPWPQGRHDGYRRSEVTSVVGQGDDVWRRAVDEVLRWGVKTRSGFSVDCTTPVVPGQRVSVTVTFLGLSVVEPVEVVSVVNDGQRAGFAYRTRPGHPVRGEEAFIVSRHDDEVRLTVRSLTRAAPRHPWRLLFPILLLVQRVVRRRYLRSLLP
ncbi:DUF1990 domain-containing protein [Arthrobacter sp. NamB2]|uniref:DUF1990 family protein n=1 Tax=Arthrobacter sp. NamB2 TaxID=2576035 RepID=UPI0010C9E21B|nr:DUF1990 family protein [Arthrobacter sp. NamB2]TKV28145.1 DUF1990 domain-containing protein [Arthrobacter sp. NamB2]